MRYLLIMSLLLVGCAKDGKDGRNGKDFTPPVVDDPDIPPTDGEEIPQTCLRITKHHNEWICCVTNLKEKCKRTHTHSEEECDENH